MRKALSGLSLAAVLALVLAIPAAAGVVYSGIDLWRTPGDGSTFADFAGNPIPSDFFCAGSAPFDGKVSFEGVPVATTPAGALGRADTIVQRLDDARVELRGQASTRVQVRALSLASVAPVETSCGLYSVIVSLDGPQPVTRMRIFRDHDEGGRYVVPLHIRARLTFVPVAGRASEPRTLSQTILFAPTQNAAWSSAPGRGGVEVAGFVSVDTDGDREADTHLPGTSNFAAGWRPAGRAEAVSAVPQCHCDPSQSFGPGYSAAGGSTQCAHLHCPQPVLQ